MSNAGEDVALSIDETNRCAVGWVHPLAVSPALQSHLPALLRTPLTPVNPHTRRLRASLGLKPLSLEAPKQEQRKPAAPVEEPKPDAEAIRAKLTE
jgi:hypothetical protein